MVAVSVVGLPNTVGLSLTAARPVIASSTTTEVVAVNQLTLLLAVTTAV